MVTGDSTDLQGIDRREKISVTQGETPVQPQIGNAIRKRAYENCNCRSRLCGYGQRSIVGTA